VILIALFSRTQRFPFFVLTVFHHRVLWEEFIPRHAWDEADDVGSKAKIIPFDAAKQRQRPTDSVHQTARPPR
jgi:hypothetical protein